MLCAENKDLRFTINHWYISNIEQCTYSKNFIIQRLAFAKTKSNIIAKAEGIAAASVKPSKRQREAEQSLEDTGSNKEQRLIVNNTPNKILLAQNLPVNFDVQMLTALFQQLPGLTDIRIPPGNKGIAFIEFQDEIQAGGALRQLNGLVLAPNVVLQLTYSN